MKYRPLVSASFSKLGLLASSVAALWLAQPAGAQDYDNGASQSVEFITVGSADGSVESVTITNPGTVVTTTGLTIGGEGDGTINVTNGGQLENTGFSMFGSVAGGVGRLNLSGANSSASLMGGVRFGENGSAVVMLQNSAVLNISNGAIGRFGGGQINIVTGGVLNVADGLQVGANAGGTGQLLLNGNGSSAYVTKFAHIGWEGMGTLTLQQGAHFSVNLPSMPSPNDGNLDIGSYSGTDATAGGSVVVTGRTPADTQNPVPDDFSSLNVARSINLGGNGGYGVLELGTTGVANAANVWIKSGQVILAGGFLTIDPVGEFDGINVESGGRFNLQSGGFSSRHVFVNGGRLNFGQFFAIPTKEVVVEGSTKHLANWFLNSAAWFDHSGLSFGQNAADEVQVNVTGGSMINGSAGVNIGWEGKGTVRVNGGSTIKGGHLNIGAQAGSTGELHLGATDYPGGFATFAGVNVGGAGTGRLQLNAASSLNAAEGLSVGMNAGSDGLVTLNDAGTHIHAMRHLTVGAQGKGELRLQNGADLMLAKAEPTSPEDNGGGHMSVGQNVGVDAANPGGRVVVSGTAMMDEADISMLNVAEGIRVGGANGYGVVEVSNRGLVQTKHVHVERGHIFVGSQGELRIGSEGGLNLMGSGGLHLDGGKVTATWLNHGGHIGGRGTIQANVNGGGSIDVGQQDAGGILQINGQLNQSSTSYTRIDFFNSTFDQLKVEGNITTGGVIEVHFAEGFVPVNGRSYRVIEWTGTRMMSGDVQIQGLDGLSGWAFYPSWQDKYLALTAVSTTGGLELNDGFADDRHWANWSTSGSLAVEDNRLSITSPEGGQARTWVRAPVRDNTMDSPNHFVGPVNTPWSVSVQVHMASGSATVSGDILRGFLFVNQQPAVGSVPDNDLVLGLIRSNNVFPGAAGDGVASSVVVRRNYLGSLPTVVPGTAALTDVIIKLDYTAEKKFVTSYALPEEPEVFHPIAMYDAVELWGVGAASFFRVSLAGDAESRNPSRNPAHPGFAPGDLYFTNFKSTGLLVESAAQAVAGAAAANLPNITLQPSHNGPVGALQGAPVNLSVSATGPELTYQWRRNSNEIEGATSANFTIEQMAVDRAGRYDVAIGNSSGTIISEGVMVHVLQPTAAFPNFAWRNPLPRGDSLNDVVFANNRFVAVGVSGRIERSNNGLVWTTTNVPSQALNAVTHSAALGRFFAVGAGSDIYASADGASWSRQTTSQFDYLQAVAASPERVVAAGGNGVVHTSTDGVTWTRRQTPVWSIHGLAFGNGWFVSVGHGGQVQRSQDAATWTAATLPSQAQNAQINKIKFIDGQFIAVGGNGLAMTSNDGAAWTVLTTNSGGYFRSVGKFGSNWVINDADSSYIRSTDLATFSMGRVPGSTGAYMGVASGAGRMVMVGAGGSITASTDAVNWLALGSSGGNDGFFDGIVVDGLAVIVGNEGTIMTTSDGVQVTRRGVQNYRNALSAITHDGTQFVVATQWSQVLTSPDAISWTIQDTNVFTTWNGAASKPGRTVIVGNQGKIAYSADAITWAEATSPVTTDLRDVTRWGEGFVAVGNQGRILTSVDGQTWVQRTSGTNNNLNAVKGWEGALFAVGDAWTLLKSVDGGATWSPLPLSQSGGWSNRDIAKLTNGLFVITTDQGNLVTSPDGEHWSTQGPIGTSEQMHLVMQLADSIMLAGRGGAILQSTVPSAITPAVTVQPESRTVIPGSEFELSIEVAGSGPYSFQWFRNGEAITGATDRRIRFVNADSADAGEYSVAVYHLNGAPVQSNVASITVGGGSSGEPGDGSGGASIIGSWIHGDPVSGEAVVVTFFANGSYYLAHDGEADDTGGPGMERGVYTWNAATGAFDANIEGSGDTTGEWGLSHIPAGAKIVLTDEGATFELLVADEEEAVVFKRVASAANPLVGGWLYGEAGALESAVVTFTANGYYFLVEDGIADESGGPGMEMGSYTFEGGTLVTTAMRETNADWGLGMVGGGPVSFPTAIDDKTLLLEEDDEEQILLVRATAIGLPPMITAQPFSRTVLVGSTTTFQVFVDGTPEFAYQWFKDGQAISGASGSSLTLSDIQTSHAGSYTVMIGNIAGTVTSKAAVLTVNVPNVAPSIVTQPTNSTVAENELVVLSVGVTGTSPMHYQWRKNGANIDGATNRELRFIATPGKAGDYTVTVTNSVGSVTSSTAKVTVNAVVIAPTIAASPVNQIVTAGTPVRFAVGATGTAPLSYQWMRNGEQIPGATTSTLLIANPQEADEGNYNVIVTNSAHFATSAVATLTVNPAVLAPFITTQPLSQTVTAGESASFTVVASGTAPFSYQWQRNGTALPGATTATLTIPAAKAAHAGSYNVVVSNIAGQVTSTSARLNVTPAGNPPVFTVQPVSRTVTAGENVTFNATVTGSDTITYQWRRNGAAISGATMASLTLNDVQSANVGSYTLVATNEFGSATSSLASLTVNPAVFAPSITSAKVAAGALGSPFSYTITASNTPTSFGATGLPSGLSVDSTTGAISGTATEAGTFTVNLAATNAGGTGNATLTLIVVQPVPVVTSPAGAKGRVGEAFSYTITGTNSPTNFGAANLPSGLSLNTATGVISGVPTSDGAFNVGLTASNSAGSSQVFLLALRIAPSASVPVVTSAAAATGKVGEPFTYVIAASNNPTAFAATGLPPGISVNPSVGLISGTPTTAGTFDVTVTASNATGAGHPLTVRVTIAPAATVPVITSSTSVGGTAGQPLSYAIKATNSPTSFTASALPPGVLLDQTTGVISGTVGGTGTFVVAIGATNSAGTGVAVVTFNVAPALTAPTITSSASARGRVGEMFNYAIIATNTPTGFIAAGLPTGLSLDPSTGIISGTPGAAGTFAVTLVASNNDAGASFTLTLTIAPAALAPVVTSDAAAVATTGTLFSYQITATNGPITGYSAEGLPAGLALNPLSGLITGTPTQTGSFTVNLAASNAGGTSAPLALLLTVKAGIDSPAITSSLTASGTQGELFTYLITASNMPLVSPLPPGNGYEATDLPEGLALNPANGIIVGIPTETGTFNVGLSATNDAGTGATKTLVITIHAAANAPVITSGTSAAATAGSVFAYRITALNTPTGFDITSGPAWLSVDTDTGWLTGTPTAPGEFSATLVASNSAGTSAPVALTIAVGAAAGSPSVTSTLSASGAAGSPFTYQIGANNGPLTGYAASGLPDGLSLNTATGEISGTTLVPGTYRARIAAENAIGLGASKTLVINISAAAGSPVIGGGATGNSDVQARTARGFARALTVNSDATQVAQVDIPSAATVGEPYSFQITASGNPTSFSASGLPTGLAVNPGTGLISGAPAVAGTFRIEIRATNDVGVGPSATLVLTVGAPPTAPTINSAASASGKVGEAFSYSATATNSPTSFNASGLPAGLVLDSTTGAITGSPTTPGTFNAKLSANNAAGTGAEFTLTITVAAADGTPTISSAATASGQVGDAFTYQVVASESPTSYTAAGLPAGLAIDLETGAISGTPVSAGTSVASVTARNATGASAPFTLTITIAPAATTSAITSAANVSVTAGTSFAYSISATNSPTSYNVSGLPAGLSANTTTGLIDGVPTVPGTYEIVISANNAIGTGATFTLTLVVNPEDDTPGEPGGVAGARLTALATRAYVGAGDKVLITGFVIAGSEAKPVMVRAGGPALTAQGVTNALQNPRIELYRQQSHIDANDDWGSEGDANEVAATATRVGAYAFASGSKDAVIVTTLEPGLYTAIIHGNGGAGVALAEIYDISEALPAEAPRLTAISARGDVGVGENIMIAGLVINGNQPKRVLVRAVGPSLEDYGVPGALTLANPVLHLFRSGVLVGENDDWANGNDAEEVAAAAAQVGAFPIAESSKDAAFLVTLQPGAYTVHASGAGNTTGVALIEVYELP